MKSKIRDQKMETVYLKNPNDFENKKKEESIA